MDQHEAMDHLATIRRIMESATQMTVLPGKAAICGGALALIGCVVTWFRMHSLDFGALGQMTMGHQNEIIMLWVIVALGGVGIDVFMTVRLARKRGLSAWSRLAQLATYAMGAPVVCALLLSIVLADRDAWSLIPAVWMLLYGTAIWMVGVLSARSPQALGLVFLIGGALTLFIPSFALVTAALTFGFGHIVFGIYLVARYGE